MAEKLQEFGLDEVHKGFARNGVIGVLRGRGPGKTIGLRADMDALPLAETTGRPWVSKIPGKMHACGHDGHTAMLLAAARYLANEKNFNGTVVFIFQPAEERGAGAKVMIEEGVLDRFKIENVFGMHNLPGLPVGRFAIRSGAIMAATDDFTIHLRGMSGHAALPHAAIDPIVAASQIVINLQTLVSRNVDPLDSAVVSVCKLHSGTAMNIIPDTAEIAGTIRTLNPATRQMLRERFHEVVESICAAHRINFTIDFEKNAPAVLNADIQTEVAIRAATDVVGESNVEGDTRPIMGGEDFAYMLEARPGAFMFIGNGDSAPLHNSNYDFDDEALQFGVGYWLCLVNVALNTSA
ncbi:hippurate hydrolase [Phyllobacterium endophyticum]|nr:hippurate hydrolase [Phyllobacterium endophyticum]